MTVTADQPTPETTHARPDRETVEAWILAIPLAATNALANGEIHGIWGGLTERERRQVKQVAC